MLFLFFIESARAEVWPFNYDTEFAKQSIKPEILRTRTITPVFEKLSKKGALAKYSITSVMYTNKAMTSTLCSTFPYPADWTVEAEKMIYKKCLPKLLKENMFKTAFIQPAQDFERGKKVIKNTGFEQTTFFNDDFRDKFPSTNYFGPADKDILPFVADWVDDRISNQENFFLTYITNSNHHPFTPSKNWPKRDYIRQDSPEPEKETIRDYLNSVSYIDSFIGDFTNEFESRGLMNSTLFVFVGDHGYSWGEHGNPEQVQNSHDNLFRVPMLLYTENEKYKPLLEGKTIEGRRGNIDVLPTILDFLNPNFTFDTRFEYGYEGNSVLHPDLGKPQISFSNPGFSSAQFRQYGLKMNYNPKTFTFKFFDIEKDPYEKQELDLYLYEGGRFKDFQEYAKNALWGHIEKVNALFDSK